MSGKEIFYPMLAMVALTLVVWLRLYLVRIPEMRRLRIHPQSLATSAQKSARLVDTRAADNFINLLEVPVLFYLALIVAYLTQQANAAGARARLGLRRWPRAAQPDPVQLQQGHASLHRVRRFDRPGVGAVGGARDGFAARMSDEQTARRSRRNRTQAPALALPARHARTRPVVRPLPRPRMEAGFRRRSRGFPTASGMRGR